MNGAANFLAAGSNLIHHRQPQYKSPTPPHFVNRQLPVSHMRPNVRPSPPKEGSLPPIYKGLMDSQSGFINEANTGNKPQHLIATYSAQQGPRPSPPPPQSSPQASPQNGPTFHVIEENVNLPPVSHNGEGVELVHSISEFINNNDDNGRQNELINGKNNY